MWDCLPSDDFKQAPGGSESGGVLIQTIHQMLYDRFVLLRISRCLVNRGTDKYKALVGVR